MCCLFFSYYFLLLPLRESNNHGHAFQKTAILKNKYQRICFLKKVAINGEKKSNCLALLKPNFWKMNKMGLYRSALLVNLSTLMYSVFAEVVAESPGSADSSWRSSPSQQGIAALRRWSVPQVTGCIANASLCSCDYKKK